MSVNIKPVWKIAAGLLEVACHTSRIAGTIDSVMALLTSNRQSHLLDSSFCCSIHHTCGLCVVMVNVLAYGWKGCEFDFQPFDCYR